SWMDGGVLASQSQIASADFTVPDEPGGHKLGRIGGDGETESLRRQDNGGIHANHSTGGIDQWSAGVPGIQRGVRLNDIIHQPSRLCPHRPPQGTDDSGGHRLLETIGTTDGNRDLAYLE